MYIPKDKETLIQRLEDVGERKRLEENSMVNPRDNIIWRTIDDVSDFASDLLGERLEEKPTVHLAHMSSEVLKKNKFSQAWPFFDPISKIIYLNLSDKLDTQYGRYSFQHLSDLELQYILAHEYFHFLELSLLKSVKLSDNKEIAAIISESRADYFAWMYLKTLSRKEGDLGKNFQKFIQRLGASLVPYGLEFSAKIFYLIDWDVHGSVEHRCAMYQRWFYEGTKEYLLNHKNFSPQEIVYVSCGTKFFRKQFC